jgi:hypothetical protein
MIAVLKITYMNAAQEYYFLYHLDGRVLIKMI